MKFDRTPWGKPNEVYPICEGAWEVSCPGHGGIKLDRARNARIPTIWRNAGGWYEEDCEYNIVVAFLPEFRDAKWPDREKADAMRKSAIDNLRRWWPDRFETYFREPVLPGQSHVRDRELFEEAHKDDFVSYSASGSWHPTVPIGEVGVWARRSSDGEKIAVLVPERHYDARGRFGLIVDSSYPAWDTE